MGRPAGSRELGAVETGAGVPVLVTLEGHDLPGRAFCSSEGEPYENVQVGIQVRKDPEGLVPGDAPSATWHAEVDVLVGADGELDFRGPAVHGRRGDRFLYLTWGNVDAGGGFEMFRRAKLMLDRIDADLVRASDAPGNRLVGRVRMSDGFGAPRCARVDPPDIEWRVDREISD